MRRLTRLVISRDEHRPKTSVTTQDLPCGAVPFPPPDIRKCGCQKFEKFDGFRSVSNHPTNIIHIRNIHIHMYIYIYTHSWGFMIPGMDGQVTNCRNQHPIISCLWSHMHTHILTHAYIIIHIHILNHSIACVKAPLPMEWAQSQSHFLWIYAHGKPTTTFSVAVSSTSLLSFIRDVEKDTPSKWSANAPLPLPLPSFRPQHANMDNFSQALDIWVY